MVHAYELIQDLARRLNKEPDDIFFMATRERGLEDIYSATLYDIWSNRNQIPEWLENWAIDMMIGRFQLKGGLD